MIDLIVAGGGPAGLAVSLYARRQGMDVLIVEPRDAPVDKACGEGLMPPAVQALDGLGVGVDGVPFAGIRYITDGASVDGRFRHGCGLGVRRTALHAALSAAADRAGVRRVRRRVADVRQERDRVLVDGLPARWLVGADGLHSTVRRLAGIPVVGARAPRTRFGIRRHYAVTPWTDFVEVYWAADAEAYVTPVGSGCVGVAILCGPGATFDERMDGFPALRQRLAGAVPASDVRGAGPLRQRVARRVAGRIVLVGDSAGYVDALTGEGIGLAFATARAAVDCLASGRPEDYDRRWLAATREHRMITAALLAGASRPALRRQLVPAAARLPWLFTYAVNRLAR